jgi:DNA-binding SARP family transcriptional activator
LEGSVEFRVLGPLEVVDGDRPLELGGRRQRALLACLLVHANEVIAAERLIEELWGGGSTGANALQVSVSRLRRVLGPDDRVLTQPPGYLLRVGPGELDRDEFECLFAQARRALEQGRAAEAAVTLRRALALWRGPPFADFVYEPFAQAEIARLDEARIACLEERIEAELAGGLHAELVGELEALTKEHPVRERLRTQLMLALYRCGRQADALTAYQAARQLLVAELGIEPSDELRELEQAILRQDPQLKVPSSPIATEAEAETRAGLRAALAVVPTSTRRTVTVLVAGAGGPAPAGQDPELRRQLSSRFFERVAPVLERHGAAIERLRDDRIMGVFGVPVAHEDDALRAIRAAVELREAFALEDNPFCIGIDTGEVLTGDPALGERLITGDAGDRAASLQLSSPEAAIVISDATRSLVRDAVRVESGEPVMAGGVPASVWRLLELVPGAPPLQRRFDAPLVGRDGELSQLRQAFGRALRERRAQLFTVYGEAGIGKTRLALELASSLEGEARVFTGRCLSYGEGITYWPVREIVIQAAGDREVRQLLEGSRDADVVAARLESAIGSGTGGAVSEEIFWAVRQLVEALARESPLVLVFEDVHWAEPTLLDLIEHLADWVHDASVLIVSLTRPELLDGRPGWSGGKLNATSILLDPLTRDESAELMEELSGGAGLAPEARERIAAAAAGNPLFLEQMLAMLAQGHDEVGEIAVPPAIQALLAARLDRLEPDERRVLECASVEGETFHLSGVVELSPPETREAVASLLMSLVRKELIRPEPSDLSADEAFGFRHALIRDAAYEGVSKELRSELHARHAAWLEQATGERADQYEEFLGYHLEQAFRYRAELHGADEEALGLADRARRSLTAAGQSALRRGDARAVVNLLERARTLPASDERTRLELAPDLGYALFHAGELERAESVLSEAIERAKVLGERQIERQAWVVRGVFRRFSRPEQIDLAETRREIEDSISVFQEAGDDLALSRAWFLLWDVYMCTGEAAPQRQVAERALEHARRAGSRLDQAMSLVELGYALLDGPTPVGEAVQICEGVLHELGTDPLLEATVSAFLAPLVAMQGRFDEARVLAGRVAAMRELGMGTLGTIVEVMSGRVATLADDLNTTEQTTRAAAEYAAEIGDLRIYAPASIDLARALCDQDRPLECLHVLRESEPQAELEPDWEIVVMRPAVRALALARLGQLEEAETLAREAVSYADGTEFLGFHADALVVLAEVLRLTGRSAEAVTALEEALGLHERKGNVVSAAKARALLAELR